MGDDERAGAPIGSGIGMMIDIMDWGLRRVPTARPSNPR
jgi:hypothetical protein